MIFRWRIPIKRECGIGLTTSHYSEMKIKFSEEKLQIENIQLLLHGLTFFFISMVDLSDTFIEMCFFLERGVLILFYIIELYNIV